MPTERKYDFNAWYILAAFLALMLFQAWWNVWSQVETISYSEFLPQLHTDNMTEATVTETCIEGTLKTVKAYSKSRFVTRRVAHHEMGHALVASMPPGVDPVAKMSIIQRGVGALGYTILTAQRRALEPCARLLIEREALAADELHGLLHPSGEDADGKVA